MILRDASLPVDKIEADIVAFPFFEDERPLRTVAGIADWRMNGALSKLILDGVVSGREGESLLMSTGGRLSSSRLLLFGLGDSKMFDAARFQTLLSSFAGTLARLKFGRIAITTPGSSLFSAKNVGDVIKREFEKAGMPDDAEVIIIN